MDKSYMLVWREVEHYKYLGNLYMYIQFKRHVQCKFII